MRDYYWSLQGNKDKCPSLDLTSSNNLIGNTIQDCWHLSPLQPLDHITAGGESSER